METITIWMLISPQGGPHIKVTGMLVVWLWGVQCRFWSHLGWLERKVTIFAIQVSLSTVHKEIYKNALTRTTQKSPLGVTLSLSHTNIFPTILRRASPSLLYGSPPGCSPPPFPYPMLFMITQELYALVFRKKQQIWKRDGESTFSV